MSGVRKNVYALGFGWAYDEEEKEAEASFHVPGVRLPGRAFSAVFASRCKETMTVLLVFLLANFGFAYIVGFARISASLRELLSPYMKENDPTELAPGVVNAARYWFVSLLECPACLNWWTGGALGPMLGPILGIRFCPNNLGEFLIWACATSGSSFVLARLTRLI